VAPLYDTTTLTDVVDSETAGFTTTICVLVELIICETFKPSKVTCSELLTDSGKLLPVIVICTPPFTPPLVCDSPVSVIG
jgi:hypothetical protein